MNFLAHLYLGPPDPQRLLGGLLGDFVNGRVVDMDLPAAVREGVWLHRQIDLFTDAHPLVRRSKQRVSPERRRFAGILVDMFYDHLLARYWDDFSEESLDSFTRRSYRLLLAQRDLIPLTAWPIIERMATHDWLSSYAELGSLHLAVNNTARRFRRETSLTGGVAELEADYAGFEADFRLFLPEVRAFARAQAVCAATVLAGSIPSGSIAG
jgi:acyl carrier protein phosphodiesterase